MADGTKKNKEKSEKNNYRKRRITINNFNRTTLTMPIDSGGSIEFPPGSLPDGAKVTIEPTRTPLLPDDVIPVGEAYSIKTTSELAHPVFVHLPVPEGIEDISKLVLYRVESDGTTTYLVPHIEGDELIAATPGFSIEGIAELVNAVPGKIQGPDTIRHGEFASYYLVDVLKEAPLDIDVDWRRITGPVQIVDISGVVAIVEASDDISADAKIFALSLDRVDGKRYYAYKNIDVQSSAGSLNLSLTTVKPVVFENECIQVSAYVDKAELPVTWKWWYMRLKNDQEPDGILESSNQPKIDLPCHKYSLPDGDTETDRWVTVFVMDRNNYKDKTIWLKVKKPVIKVNVNGPTRLVWTEPSVHAEYIAEVTGGTSASYNYKWRVQPKDDESFIEGGDSWKVTFDEPGSYIVSVIASDEEDQRELTASLPVVIKGKDLEASFVDEPSSGQGSIQSFNYSASSAGDSDDPVEAEVGDTISANLLVRHGILIINGKKGNYEVEIDWDDGTVTPRITVDAESSVIGGTTGDIEHVYQEAKTYTVTATVYDATGNSTQVSESITVVEKNSPPEAESQSVSTEKDTAKSITLTGSDADNDQLTYTIVDEPDHGTLSGTAPDLTYKPASGYTGSDSFTFYVSDGKSDSSIATVSINVKNPGERAVIWELIRTEIIPDSGTESFSWTRGSFEPLDSHESSASLTEGSISVMYKYTQWNGRVLRTTNSTINFTNPPSKIIPDEPFEIRIDGTLEASSELLDGSVQYLGKIHTASIAVYFFYAESDGNFPYAPWSNIPEGFSLRADTDFYDRYGSDADSKVLTYTLWRPTSQVSNYFHRIEVRSAAPSGESGGHVMKVAWIYQATEVQ